MSVIVDVLGGCLMDNQKHISFFLLFFFSHTPSVFLILFLTSIQKCTKELAVVILYHLYENDRYVDKSCSSIMASNVPTLPQAQQIGQHQQQQPPQPSDLDAIHNKQLIPQLRESLAVLYHQHHLKIFDNNFHIPSKYAEV